jgi:hypothetical protein
MAVAERRGEKSSVPRVLERAAKDTDIEPSGQRTL